MASKKAYVFVLDLGSTLAECHNGRTVTDLDWGMQWAWDKMATIMERGLKGANVGVVAFRTDETQNPLADGADEDDESYNNISVLKELGPLEIADLRGLQEVVQPSSTETGDVISALIVAIDRIDKFTVLKTGKPGKFERYIYLLTDGQGEANGDDLDEISTKLNESGIELTVIGVDFDCEDPEFVEEDKSAVKRQNESMLSEIVEKCKAGTFATALQAVEGIATPAIREVKPVTAYSGTLDLGDYKSDMETSMAIEVVRYPKTKTARAPSASKFVPVGGPQASSGDLSSVKFKYTYEVLDPTGPDGKKAVDREDLAKGYMYGRTIVPLSEEDAAIARLPTFQSFSIIGFIPQDKYEKALNMGESHITVPAVHNDKAKMAISSLVRALHETESYAVARLVTKNDRDPQIVLMAPLIEPDLDALVDVPLPFAEDIRVYQFPPLDRVITTSGAVLTQHRNLPSKDLLDAMSKYVDIMDLSSLEEDDEGKPSQYMPFEDTYNPAIHRINQAVRQRAIYPDQELTEPAPILTKYQYPPRSLVADAESALQKLISLADVKKVDERKKGRGKRTRDSGPAPLSGINIDALLKDRKKTKITEINAIPEFKQMISPSEPDAVPGNAQLAEAMKQMGEVTREVIRKSSLGGTGYDIALRQISEMRTVAVNLEIHEPYNEFVTDLKEKISSGALGERKDFWFKFKRAGFGLISQEESEYSEVNDKQAEEFYNISNGIAHRSRTD